MVASLPCGAFPPVPPHADASPPCWRSGPHPAAPPAPRSSPPAPPVGCAVAGVAAAALWPAQVRPPSPRDTWRTRTTGLSHMNYSDLFLTHCGVNCCPWLMWSLLIIFHFIFTSVWYITWDEMITHDMMWQDMPTSHQLMIIDIWWGFLTLWSVFIYRLWMWSLSGADKAEELLCSSMPRFVTFRASSAATCWSDSNWKEGTIEQSHTMLLWPHLYLNTRVNSAPASGDSSSQILFCARSPSVFCSLLQVCPFPLWLVVSSSHLQTKYSWPCTTLYTVCWVYVFPC